MGSPLAGLERDPGQVEQAQHVQVVALVGHGEADQVEVGQRPLGFEREGPAAAAAELIDVHGVGEEHPLAHDVGDLVQMPVDRLESEVRHPHGVRVRIDERDRDATAPVLADRALLGREQGLGLSLQ